MGTRQTQIQTGVDVGHGCRIIHGDGANIKKPFADIPLTMHELYAGSSAHFQSSSSGDFPSSRSYKGQFGFISFTSDLRLPRHVHITTDKNSDDKRALVAERILVLNGVGLVELCGAIFVVAPGSLVDIAPGVPHTWTACPMGVKLPGSNDGSGRDNGMVSNGTFLMAYEYEQTTGFYPYEETEPITSVDEYHTYEGDLEKIRFPKLTAMEISARARCVWNRTVTETLEIVD